MIRQKILKNPYHLNIYFIKSLYLTQTHSRKSLILIKTAEYLLYLHPVSNLA